MDGPKLPNLALAPSRPTPPPPAQAMPTPDPAHSALSDEELETRKAEADAQVAILRHEMLVIQAEQDRRASSPVAQSVAVSGTGPPPAVS